MPSQRVARQTEAAEPAADPTGGADEVAQLREELRDARQHAAYADAIVATSRAPTAVLDAALRITTANRAFCDYFNATLQDVLGENIRDIEGKRLRSPGLDNFLEAVLRIPPTTIEDFEIEIAAREGGSRHLMLNARRLIGVLRYELILLSFEDVTERRGTEAGALHRAALKGQARESEAFSHSVSHDLRTPLRTISGLVTLMLKEPSLGPDTQRHLRSIDATVRKMSAIVEGLLGLSQLIRHPIQRQEIDMTRLAHEVVAELQERGRRHPVRFVIQDGVRGQGDPTLVGLLLQHLLENAWKFTAPRKDAVVEFGVEKVHDEPHYVVRDNGVGFDMGMAETLFLPFQRLTHEQEFPGTGIGLAAVRRIAERHGGHIEAEGERGTGATFYFTLGQKPPAAPAR